VEEAEEVERQKRWKRQKRQKGKQVRKSVRFAKTFAGARHDFIMGASANFFKKSSK